MKRSKNQRHSGNQTQWAAQYAVASELVKRGYQVAFTMGNHPIVDLMAISPKGTEFLVDVKGQHKPNAWLLLPKAKTKKLFYILAQVPQDAENRFFVLTQRQANEAVRADWQHAIAIRKGKGLAGPPKRFKGFQRKSAERFENAWRALPP